jgi:hypothetical protein
MRPVVEQDDGAPGAVGHPVDEHIPDWHTARVPTARSRSAGPMAWLPLIEPFDPPTVMLWEWW